MTTSLALARYRVTFDAVEPLILPEYLGSTLRGAFGHALSAVDLAIGPAREVAIVGDPDDAATSALVGEVVRARYLPNVVLAVGSPDDAEASAAVPLLADRTTVDGRPAAYVCTGFLCRRPVTGPAELAAELA